MRGRRPSSLRNLLTLSLKSDSGFVAHSIFSYVSHSLHLFHHVCVMDAKTMGFGFCIMCIASYGAMSHACNSFQMQLTIITICTCKFWFTCCNQITAVWYSKHSASLASAYFEIKVNTWPQDHSHSYGDYSCSPWKKKYAWMYFLRRSLPLLAPVKLLQAGT